jgi:succinate dehydrogenase/fumarate reductase flavoprotein subunit
VNDKAEASIKNLFVAGDASCGLGDSGSKAIVWGLIVGDHVSELTTELKQAAFDGQQIKQVEADKKRTLAPLGKKSDVVPLELEDYIRKINMNYIGIRKIGPRLKRAIDIMRVAKERFVPTLSAGDPHELMRALEVQDIIDLSELHAQFSLLRTESRDTPNHYRIDYPKQDDEHWQNVIITAQNLAGEAKYEVERMN